jgi:uncharacterized protein with HEPN domain
MVAAAREIGEFLIGKTYSDFVSNRMLRLAIERDIEIVGEAARRVSAEFRTEHPEVPWGQIVSQRNVIIHEYDELKLERMWVVATERIGELIPLLEPLMPSPEEE